MPGLDAERVRAAAARWVFVPVDAVDVTTDEYRLVPLRRRVRWCTGRATSRPLRGRAGGGRRPREGGRPDRPCSGGSTNVPARRTPRSSWPRWGCGMTERLEVLALPVTTELPMPDDVTVAEVRDLAGLELAGRLQSEVFGSPPRPSPEVLEDQLRSVTVVPEAEQLGALLRRVRGRRASWLRGRGDGRRRRAPVLGGLGAAGLPGEGASIAPWSPGRLVDARPTTADFALVKAVDDTSAPILRRLGFLPVRPAALLVHSPSKVESCLVRVESGLIPEHGTTQRESPTTQPESPTTQRESPTTQSGAGGRRSRRRRPACPGPRSRSCGERSAACPWGCR